MKYPIILLVVLSAIWVSCKKEHPERIDYTYQCNCGELRWNNVAYPLSAAEYITETDSSLARRYYITADVKGESEDEEVRHHLNMDFLISDVELEIFYPESDSNAVVINIEEVIEENDLVQVLKYRATVGSMNVSQNIGSDTEVVNFNIGATRVINGDLVGESQPLTGEFTVER